MRVHVEAYVEELGPPESVRPGVVQGAALETVLSFEIFLVQKKSEFLAPHLSVSY